jgi:hypothetical protein
MHLIEKCLPKMQLVCITKNKRLIQNLQFFFNFCTVILVIIVVVVQITVGNHSNQSAKYCFWFKYACALIVTNMFL